MTATKGLTPEIAAAAQKSSLALGKAKDLQIPLDQYLKTKTTKAVGKSKSIGNPPSEIKIPNHEND